MPSPQPTSNPHDRTAFFVSDGTGITAETFGSSLLSQFEDVRIRYVRLSFIDSEQKAVEAVARINQQGRIDGKRPIVFSTLVNTEISDIVHTAGALYLNLIATFVEPLEAELGVGSSHGIGRFHRITSPTSTANGSRRSISRWLMMTASCTRNSTRRT